MDFSSCKTWQDVVDRMRADVLATAGIIAQEYDLEYLSHFNRGGDEGLAFAACLTNTRLHALIEDWSEPAPFITFSNGWTITNGEDVKSVPYGDLDNHTVPHPETTIDWSCIEGQPSTLLVKTCLHTGHGDVNIYGEWA